MLLAGAWLDRVFVHKLGDELPALILIGVLATMLLPWVPPRDARSRVA